MANTRKSFSDEVEVQVNVFQPDRGGDREVHLTIRPRAHGTFTSQLRVLESAYFRVLGELGLSDESALFRRFFLSDSANQRGELENSKIASVEAKCAVSVVEQPPCEGQKLCLWAYLIEGGNRRRTSPRTVALTRGELTHVWTTGMRTAPSPKNSVNGSLREAPLRSSAVQTKEIFESYREELRDQNCSIRDNAVRTWLYVRDVDTNYQGLVRARGEFFEAEGLSRETHFITSTGIEGRQASAEQLVLMDAYAISGLLPGQQRYLTAESHLGPTADYGVHFERGVRVDFADRAHLWISGTASIAPSGETIHIGNVERQLERTCSNIEALLANGGAQASDLVQLILYVRDPADQAFLTQGVRRRWPGVPMVAVLAPVCRPSFLVEIECLATVSAASSKWPRF